MQIRTRVCQAVGAMLCCVSALSAQRPTISEKSWPQQFSLEGGDRVSYGIVVGMPGAISINVTASGQVAVALDKPNGSQARTAMGSGTVRIEYVATKEDIAAGEAWRVTLADPTGGRRPTSAGLSGTISVAHPPGDVRKVKVPTVARKPIPLLASTADPDPSLQNYRAAREAAQTAARAARSRALQGKVSAAAAAATQSGALPTAPRGAAAGAGARTSTTRSASTGTGNTGGGGTAPVGTNQPATTLPLPVVASLDTAGGSPGDEVFVTGSGFTPATGLEAHFVIGPQKDFTGAVTYYNDKQIMVQVPDKEGLPSYAGRFYLRRGSNNSNLVPFRFDPKMDYAVLPPSTDRQLGGDPTGTWVEEGHYFGHIPEWFSCKADDEFFLHTNLANGWVIDSAYVRQQNHGPVGPQLVGTQKVKGDAYVSAWTRGSGSPRIKVHWWCEDDFFAPTSPEVHYWPVVVIRGPKGLSWQ